MDKASGSLKEFGAWESDYFRYKELRQRLERGEALLSELSAVDSLADRLLSTAYRVMKTNAVLFGYREDA